MTPGRLAQGFIALTTALFASTSVAGQLDVDALGATRVRVTTPPERPSLVSLAEAVAEQTAAALPHEGRGELLLRVDDRLPEGGPGRDALVSAVLSPLRQRLSGEPAVSTLHSEAGAGEPGDARQAGARGFDLMLAVSFEVSAPELRIRLRLYRAGGPSFAALFVDRTELLGDSELTVGLDAELLAHLGPLPRVDEEHIVASSVPLPRRDYLALAVADLDRDGRAELVLVRADSIEVLRARRGGRGVRLERLGRVALPPPAPLPVGVRRVFATATADDGAVLVRLSNGAGPLRVRYDGAISVDPVVDPCESPGHPLPDVCAVPVPGRDYFASVVAPLRGGAPPPRAPTSFYVRRAAPIRQPDGSAPRVEAVVTPRGRLAVRTGSREAGVPGFGAALGLADIDLDGQVELIASAATLEGRGDKLTVLRVRPSDGVLLRLWESEPLSGSVFVADGGDLDGDGRAELLAIEEPANGQGRASLWVLR